MIHVVLALYLAKCLESRVIATMFYQSIVKLRLEIDIIFMVCYSYES